MPGRGGPTIPWLEALKNLGAETTQEVEIDTDAASSAAAERLESLAQQGVKREKEGLLALLTPRRLAYFEKHTPSTVLDTTGEDRTSHLPFT
jgi:hypothetical protein